MPTFDEEREANIARNKALLASIGVVDDLRAMIPQKKAPQPKRKPAPKKRKAPTPDPEGSDTEGRPAPKIARAEDEDAEGGLRRSRRNMGKTIDYGEDGVRNARNATPRIISEKARRQAASSEPRSVLKRTHDP